MEEARAREKEALAGSELRPAIAPFRRRKISPADFRVGKAMATLRKEGLLKRPKNQKFPAIEVAVEGGSES